MSRIQHRMIGIMISVASLHVYPVKSCRGIERAQAAVTVAGLEHDREWMIVTPDGRFVTQREEPRLALIETDIDAARLRLAVAGHGAVDVPLDLEGEPRDVVVWRHACVGHDQGETPAQWLGDILGRPFRLVRFDPAHRRLSDPAFTGSTPGYSRFADAYAFLVLSRASLADLNVRLPAPLPMNRFRPNIVLEGLDAYGEDAIDELHIGALTLRLVKACTRCTIPTTDQETAERDPVEPLRTLRRYRWDPQLRGITFGQNAIVVAGAGSRLQSGQEVSATLRR